MNPIEVFVPLRNEFGMVNDAGSISDNDPLWNLLYLVILWRNAGTFTPSEWNPEIDRQIACYWKYIDKDGFTKRRPNVDGKSDAPDNLLAFAVADCLLEGGWSEKILAAIRKNGGVWPGKEPVTYRWLGRFKGLTTLLQISAKETPQYDEWFWLALSLLVSAFQKSNQHDNFNHGWLICFLLNRLSENRYHGYCAVPVWVRACVGVWEAAAKARGATMEKNLSSFGKGWRLNFAPWFSENG